MKAKKSDTNNLITGVIINLKIYLAVAVVIGPIYWLAWLIIDFIIELLKLGEYHNIIVALLCFQLCWVSLSRVLKLTKSISGVVAIKLFISKKEMDHMKKNSHRQKKIENKNKPKFQQRLEHLMEEQKKKNQNKET